MCSGGKEKTFFIAESGLYAFDGKRATPVCEPLQVRPTRTEQICKGGATEHTYSVQFVDRTGKERRIVVDAEKETGYDSFVVEGLSVARGAFCCRFEGEPHTLSAESSLGILPDDETFSFTAYGLEFGWTGEKRLQSLEFFGDGEITVTVTSERKTKTKTLVFVGGRASARFWLKGRQFNLTLALEQGAKVQSVTAEVLYG